MQDDANTSLKTKVTSTSAQRRDCSLAREAALAKRSSCVKRDMPRPTEMNHAVLRPSTATLHHRSHREQRR